MNATTAELLNLKADLDVNVHWYGGVIADGDVETITMVPAEGVALEDAAATLATWVGRRRGVLTVSKVARLRGGQWDRQRRTHYRVTMKRG
ncbi:hypothetical protein [Isoptericola dokdonensis]|uniref:Uncharacterized protein n=1 Tax=Isoptericola dokdonensis DS-3 TaxID=1300344 RepID=A0A161I794_9MICO|nr:hypothetical protein [Isoptericola dokdonensis]ANC31418.1 hypothetical protein I598_1870 [Isoptericola dokdonensis DS-3]